MPSTDGIAKVVQIVRKGLRIQGLNDVHTLLVEILDALVDVSTLLVLVGVSEPGSPVAEVGRNHKQVLRVCQVRGQ